MASDFQMAFGAFMGMDEERAAASDIKSLCGAFQGTFPVPEWVLQHRPEIEDVLALATPQELSLMVALGMADTLRVLGIDLDTVPEYKIVPGKTKYRIAEEAGGVTRQQRRGW